MIIKSLVREAAADCDTIAFPAAPKRGLKCFRVDLGKLFSFDGKSWVEVPVPVGKFWFDPNTKTMKIRRPNGWRPLKSFQRKPEELRADHR